jgi:acetyl esterase/lipase
MEESERRSGAVGRTATPGLGSLTGREGNRVEQSEHGDIEHAGLAVGRDKTQDHVTYRLIGDIAAQPLLSTSRVECYGLFEDPADLVDGMFEESAPCARSGLVVHVASPLRQQHKDDVSRLDAPRDALACEESFAMEIRQPLVRCMSRMTFCYGPFPNQDGDLHLPDAKAPAVVCLLHGGFWRLPHGRNQFSAVADVLAERGYAAWNIGYRRVGEHGGGWPGTLEDVADAIDHLAALTESVAPLDLKRVAVVGHSAGGQLALYTCADRRGFRGRPSKPRRVQPIAVAGLAAVTDMEAAYDLDLGGGAVRAWLGSTSERRHDSHSRSSPIRLLPLNITQLIVHGSLDDTVPPHFAREFARAARSAGDTVQYVELAGAGHMDFLDPSSEACGTLFEWLDVTLEVPHGNSRTADS